MVVDVLSFKLLDHGNNGSQQHPLPEQLARITDWGLYALITGIVLMGFSFLTNSVPDPSFPWATLPESLLLAYTQPRIEHWPVTYTIGLWLIVFTLPFVLLNAYHRYRQRLSLRSSTWLAALPATTMLGFTTYCRFFWPKLHPSTWNAPSYTLVCWGYCSTYEPIWSNLAYAIAFFGVGATYLAYRDSSYAKHALAIFGIFAFPLGIPALYDAHRRNVR
ncbi:hypothetical protein [Haladaptatus sp. NG-SE-30]